MMDSKVLTHPHVLMNMKNRYLLKMGNTIEWKGYFKQHWYLNIGKIWFQTSENKWFHLYDNSIGYWLWNIKIETVVNHPNYFLWTFPFFKSSDDSTPWKNIKISSNSKIIMLFCGKNARNGGKEKDTHLCLPIDGNC